MELPSAADIRDRIDNAAKHVLENDKEYHAKARQMIKDRMEEDPQSTMVLTFWDDVPTYRSQIERVMNHLCRELNEKGFGARWDAKWSTSPLGADYWSGANLFIKVPAKQ